MALQVQEGLKRDPHVGDLRLDRRSDDFLCGAGTSERFDDRVNQKWGVSSAIPQISPRAAPQQTTPPARNAGGSRGRAWQCDLSYDYE